MKIASKLDFAININNFNDVSDIHELSYALKSKHDTHREVMKWCS